MTSHLESSGYRTLGQLANSAQLEDLRSGWECNHGRRRAGRRSLLDDSPIIRRFAEEALAELKEEIETKRFFAVRALFFDKTPDANWKVAWHQDVSIAVAERREVPGFTGWSLKDGVWHVQPPATVLDRMITVRLHLDDCGTENGPLKVIPGSHREGRLSRERIEWWKAHGVIEECLVPAGGAVLMRPLLLHASSPAGKPSHRRVLHLEFAAERLPGGLNWAAEKGFSGTENFSLLTSAPSID